MLGVMIPNPLYNRQTIYIERMASPFLHEVRLYDHVVFRPRVNDTFMTGLITMITERGVNVCVGDGNGTRFVKWFNVQGIKRGR